MGGEGGGLAGEEAEEEERGHGRAGAGPQLPGAAQQVRDDPTVPGRAAAGVAPQGPAARHLLPRVALARPAVSPRAEGAGVLRVPLRLQAEGGVHQPLPLPPRGDARAAARAGAAPQRVQRAAEPAGQVPQRLPAQRAAAAAQRHLPRLLPAAALRRRPALARAALPAVPVRRRLPAVPREPLGARQPLPALSRPATPILPRHGSPGDPEWPAVDATADGHLVLGMPNGGSRAASPLPSKAASYAPEIKHIETRPPARLLRGASALVLGGLLRAEQPRRGDLPGRLAQRAGRRVHRPVQQPEPVLPGAALQREQELHHREHQAAHRQGCAPVLRRGRGLRRVRERQQHLRAEPQLQLPARLPPRHRLQDPQRLQPEDLQQPAVRPAARPVGAPRLRGRLRADEDVHHSHELREGLGCRVPPPGCHEHALLDRDPPAWAAAVAGQGADPDGLPAQPHLLGVLTVAPTRGPAQQTLMQAAAALAACRSCAQHELLTDFVTAALGLAS